MPFQPADSVSLGLFSLFSAAMLFVLLRILGRVLGGRRWQAGLVGLVLLFSVIAVSGLVSTYFIPFGPMLFASAFVFSFGFSLSSTGKALGNGLSLATLIGFQSFRLPLELILHRWAELGTIPTTMTWTGQNWDIVAGGIAIVAIPLVNKRKKLALLVNTVCFLLLLNVLRVVVFSSPLPFSWQLETPLRLVEFFPYCLIVPLFVVPAFIGHLITFRKLLMDKKAQN